MSISVLGYAILSLIARTPLSGYDIAREMRRPHSFFYGQAQYSQIYPELARLEQAELLTSQLVDQQGKPDKKLYTLSAQGLQALQEWVVAPTAIQEVRSPFLIKAHSLWVVDPRLAIEQFRVHEQQHRAILLVYEADLAEMEERYGEDIVMMQAPRFGDYVTVTLGVQYERAYLAWLRQIITVLEQRISRHTE
jgi:DNA-binding PadR family transcriptional regulator